MVVMGMSDQNMGYGFTRHSSKQRINVFINQWTRIDNRNFASPDDVGSCPMKRKGCWIACDDPTNHRCHFIDTAVLELNIADKGYTRRHG